LWEQFDTFIGSAGVKNVSFPIFFSIGRNFDLINWSKICDLQPKRCAAHVAFGQEQCGTLTKSILMVKLYPIAGTEKVVFVHHHNPVNMNVTQSSRTKFLSRKFVGSSVSALYA
jgi:hypothetical protein